MLTSPPSAGSPCSRPCAACHLVGEFIRASVLLCLEGLVSLVSFVLAGSYSLSASSYT